MKNYSCINILTPLEQTHVHIEIYIYTQVETEFDQIGVQLAHAVQYKLNAADKINYHNILYQTGSQLVFQPLIITLAMTYHHVF